MAKPIPAPPRASHLPVPGTAGVSPTMRLEYPLHDHGIEELAFRRPRAGDLLATDGLGDFALTVKLIELLAGVPPSAVKAMDAVDFNRAGLIVAGFFESSPATGGKR